MNENITIKEAVNIVASNINKYIQSIEYIKKRNKLSDNEAIELFNKFVEWQMKIENKTTSTTDGVNSFIMRCLNVFEHVYDNTGCVEVEDRSYVLCPYCGKKHEIDVNDFEIGYERPAPYNKREFDCVICDRSFEYIVEFTPKISSWRE